MRFDLALDCLTCFFVAAARAVYSAVAVHAFSRACVSPSDVASKISVLYELTRRPLHDEAVCFKRRNFEIALKPVVKMLVVRDR